MTDDILSVSLFTRRLKDALEDTFFDVWVSGEVVGYKAHTSGHIYFTLKDEGARLNAVVFRGQVRTLEIPMPEFRDGAQVVCHGRIDVYPPHGAYKLLADQVRLEGMGLLLQHLEELKRRLASEGLFDSDRKRPLPFLPNVVGIVTSPTSAAIQDMLRIIQERFPSHVRLYPAAVQGEHAAEEIVAGIEALDADPEVDVIIVGRGGGAFEDLLPFSDERVIRAVAACDTPIVSAVGHEVDFPLCDLAADVRAPTPTAAAQLVVPEHAELLRGLATRQEQMERLFLRCLDEEEEHLADAADILAGACDSNMLRFQSRPTALAAALAASHPARILQRMADRAAADGKAMDSAMSAFLERVSHRVERDSGLLQELGPARQLARGYSVVRRKSDGHVLTRAADASPGTRIEIILHEGTADAEIVP